LLVARDDELDPRSAKRLDHVEIFLARDGENSLHPFVLERAHEKIGCFGHVMGLGGEWRFWDIAMAVTFKIPAARPIDRSVWVSDDCSS
jgi:hypothetical protein